MAATVPGIVVLPYSTTNQKPVIFNPFLMGTGCPLFPSPFWFFSPFSGAAGFRFDRWWRLVRAEDWLVLIWFGRRSHETLVGSLFLRKCLQFAVFLVNPGVII
ncbi:hypothetical protein MLD38_027388 [Melastoma candidum]|uniref:Uncharacterized protein n=1 Tax=Melastoma candidum TaxID=119954 RepID=A0ACB9P2L2_9MYRT|nr:hypothetical protein MLD38_027388 [Melastoma candidum]